MVGCGVVGDVMHVNVVVFDKVGYKAHLTEVNRDNVVSGKPLKVCPQKHSTVPMNSTLTRVERRVSNLCLVAGSSEKYTKNLT